MNSNGFGSTSPKRASMLRVCYDQLRLLIWKSYKLQTRSISMTLLEIMVPAIFAVILIPIRGIVKSEIFPNSTEYEPFQIENLNFTPSMNIAYQPNNSNSTLINNIMDKVANDFNMNLYGFDNEESMVAQILEPNQTEFFLCGVSFLDATADNLIYKLRYSYSPRNSGEQGAFKRDRDWKTQFLYFLFPTLGPREKEQNDGGDPGYVREGFVQIQKAIDFAYIQSFNSSFNNISLELKRFPFPPYNDDKFVAIIAAFLPFIIVLSFVFTVIITAKQIVYEKETGLKEAMKLMGMKPWVYWLSWYIKTFLLLLPALIFMVICYKIKVPIPDGAKASMINQTDTILFALFLVLYVSSSITFTFFCTTFFKKANSAAAGAGIIWFFSYLPFIFISLRYEKMTFTEKILACFVNNLGMAQGMFMIGQFEGKGTGISFSNWTEGFAVDDKFCFLQVLIIMFFNNLIHILLTYYFENVMPSDFGSTKPWYFPVEWLLPKRNDNCNSNAVDAELLKDTEANHTHELSNKRFFEDESIYSARNIGIQIKNISKKFRQLGKVKTAVRDLSLNIYEGQISVLLGHNGAGKSTTISMITGLTVADEGGNVFINGKDIKEETEEARSVLGYCPQHNLLFNDLTVQEHLEFFSKLKRNYNQEEIDNMLELINLADKKNAKASTLSGGMKRKLSVAIAFIGGSKIVILDEPSSGMDPQARHSTWSLLQKFKKERSVTILLTTHFMDEADFLGDRIAIMSKGELRCCGSPLFLKSKYGSGYNLVITRNRESIRANSEEDSTLIQQISEIVYGHVADSKMSSNVNTELSFVLPSIESKNFAPMFIELDKKKELLGILNVGVSITTLEEVFLKINEDEDEPVVEAVDRKYGTYDNPNLLNDFNEAAVDCLENTEAIDCPLNTRENDYEEDTYGLWIGSNKQDLVRSGIELLVQQFNALIIKRTINSLRNRGLVITQLIVPIAIIMVNLLYVKYGPIKAEDSPPLTMNLSSYSPNNIPYHLSSNEADSQLANILMKAYGAQFKNMPNTLSFDLHDNSTITKCPSKRNNIDEFLSCIGVDSLDSYYNKYIVGTEFYQEAETISIIGYFNNQAYHTPSTALNLITNGLLKYFSKPNAFITVINHPLPRSIEDQVDDLTTKGQEGFQVGSGLSFGFSFLIASFVIFIIKERVSDAKHLQYMSGANSTIFWISTFVYDIINYTVPCLFVILLLVIFNVEAFINDGRFLLSFLILLFYGMAHIPQMYLLSYLFKVSSTGFASLSGLNILTGQASLLPVAILAVPALNLVETSKALEWIFLVIFPNFSLGQAFVDMYANDQTIQICELGLLFCPFKPNPCCFYYESNDTNRCGPNGLEDCLDYQTNYLSWEKPGVGRMLTFLALQFVILLAIVLIYEAGLIRKMLYILRATLSPNNEDNLKRHVLEEESLGDISKDEDVIAEEARISELNKRSQNKEIFIIDGLTKYYGNFMAVKGISFSVQKAECFGLLGVNGAGKTSTFKMITGSEMVTKGDTYVNGTSLNSNIKDFQRQLGYCPQFDPLIDQMTVYETMKMYANIRGIRSHLIQKTCMSLIQLLDLSDHVDKMCYTLSGGNKRKLSVAISLVGSPVVVLLDEPTSGMDPKTRRILWNTLNKIRNKGKSLILTTHGMDETEALCSNIGIMVNGELKCLGSLQHLTAKYGEGYTLLAKIPLIENENREKIEKFINYILSSIPNSILKESRDGFINIHIKNNETSELANIFNLVENSKDKFSIEYYVVTQTKLEQIFLNFASRQIDPETRILKKSGCF